MYRVIGVGIVVATTFIHPLVATAVTIPPHTYPKIAALYLHPTLDGADLTQLARFDVAILNMSLTTARPQILRQLKDLNPNIVLLAYTLPTEYPRDRLRLLEPGGAGVWHDLGANVQPEWYLRTADGNNLVFWPGHVLMNLHAPDAGGNTYATYLAQFLSDRIMGSGLWDGIFFDIVWDGIYFLHTNADLNRDGVAETKEESDRLWQQGQLTLFRTLRQRLGDKVLIIANGDVRIGQNGEKYTTHVNGRMFESFPFVYEGGWSGSVDRYMESEREGYLPRMNIINADSENTGNRDAYRRMRFGITSALLGSGYYNFDFGANNRDTLWYYDEYEVGLGNPTGKPMTLANGKKGGASVPWRRDFQHGIVLVNPTDTAQRIEFREDFEKIHGVQDRAMNDGAIIQEVTLAPSDGIILLRPLDILYGSSFGNGSFARVFNAKGQTTRTGFFVYDGRFRGGSDVYQQRGNGAGAGFVVADGGWIRVFNESGAVIASWQPYGSTYSGALRFAIGDVNRDGAVDIVTIPGASGIGTEVKAFTVSGQALGAGFFPFGQGTKSGGSIAVGDLNGDGNLEFVAGTGRGKSAEVRVFTSRGELMGKPIRPYPSFRGGVDVAVGDLDADGRAEIVTGTGPGGGPHVRVFNGNGTARGKGWFAYKQRLRGGVRVAVADLDQDGRGEILALTTDVFTITQSTKQLTRR
ncbi:VCBS repeat-containing protein [Candidatus Uhrbacteria bacterium]|nr:VCBS repeat-containing protein [Candidatus Uhrbacteria bacterium]